MNIILSKKELWLTDEKHKELTDKYDHYVCDICARIGAQQVISEIVEKLEEFRERYEIYPDGENMLEDLDDLIKEYKEK